MIDTTQLTNLISTFRVEKESISPETVGSLLQNITDLLANASSSTEQQAIEARQKYVTAFNQTRIKIWQEQITLLDVIDTGALLASPKAFPVRADGRFFEVGLSQAFLEYGLWQDYGTGRETPRKSSAEGGACSHLCRGAAGVAVTKRLVETPAISAVPKLLVQAERRVKLA